MVLFMICFRPSLIQTGVLCSQDFFRLKSITPLTTFSFKDRSICILSRWNIALHFIHEVEWQYTINSIVVCISVDCVYIWSTLLYLFIWNSLFILTCRCSCGILSLLEDFNNLMAWRTDGMQPDDPFLLIYSKIPWILPILLPSYVYEPIWGWMMPIFIFMSYICDTSFSSYGLTIYMNLCATCFSSFSIDCVLYMRWGAFAVHACVETCFASLISGSMCCACIREDGDSLSHTACLLLPPSQNIATQSIQNLSQI
jgi:hypothetical protein